MLIAKSLLLLAFMSMSGGCPFRIGRKRFGETQSAGITGYVHVQTEGTQRGRATQCSGRHTQRARLRALCQRGDRPPAPGTTPAGRSSTPARAL